MSQTERLYRIERLLRARESVPIATFLSVLEVSRSTFRRDIEYLRSRLNTPVEWDREARAYRLAGSSGLKRSELPGLWLSAGEIQALLTMQHLLKDLEPGVLSRHVQPLLHRLRTLLSTDDVSIQEVEKRLRIINVARRKSFANYFEPIATAVLVRKRLHIRHWNRERDEETERDVSPQRLISYRGNWYLDGWCHLRNGLRTFALDGVRDAKILNQKARAVSDSTLDKELGSGYGIFPGRKVTWATLRFSSTIARWVGHEQWHPQQRTKWLPDGRCVLQIPFSADRELMMDIMRYGDAVEVLAPMSLRQKVVGAHAAAARFNEKPDNAA